MSITPLVQYRKMLYFNADLNEQWEQYKVEHPQQSFNGLMIRLLREHLCANAAPISTTR